MPWELHDESFARDVPWRSYPESEEGPPTIHGFVCLIKLYRYVPNLLDEGTTQAHDRLSTTINHRNNTLSIPSIDHDSIVQSLEPISVFVDFPWQLQGVTILLFYPCRTGVFVGWYVK
jgi:hypothetical protein